jgi:lipopolysaccharide transport system permease protein
VATIPQTSPQAPPSIHIDARSQSRLVDPAELWTHRELLLFLTWRNINVRYRQSLLGLAWAVFEPFANVVLFTLIFHRLAKLDSGAIPFPLFALGGILGWSFFARALRGVTVSLVANAGLVTKAYFPRLILPLSALFDKLVDFGCALAMFFVLAIWFQNPLDWRLLTLPLWLGLLSVNALGVGLILATINVRFRDVTQAVTFITQLWMFATPVAYPITAIPDRWLPLYVLNPLVGAVEATRWSLLPGYPLDPSLLISSVGIGLLSLLAGLWCFSRAQRRFADIV